MKRRASRLFGALLAAGAVRGAALAQAPAAGVSAEITASANPVYANQHFTLTLTIRSVDVSMDPAFQLVSMPAADRLFVCEKFTELAPERTARDNHIFETRRFAGEVRAPVAGPLTLSPVLKIHLVRGGGFFKQITPRDVAVQPLALSVRPIPPAGRPLDFSGAIGQFSLAVDLKPTDVAVGDLVTAVLTVSGTGYLDTVSLIRMPPHPLFKAYPAKPVPSPNPREKLFEQILIPQATNATELPGPSFTYFDPQVHAYRSVTQSPFRVTFHAPIKLDTPPGAPEVQARSGAESFPKRLFAPIVFYWVAGIVLAGVFLRKSRTVALIVVLALLAGFVPFYSVVRQCVGAKPVVTVARSEKARLAPAFSAAATFDLPRGSPVTVVETSGSWVKIVSADKKGWIPSDALSKVE